MDWDKLRVFQAAADAGSFTHAGETLGLSQSAVSRQVGALEADLGAPLFHRHARGLILTEQGEMLLGAVRDVVLKLDAVRSRPDRQPRKAARRTQGHDDAGAGRQLARPAPRRVRRSLSRDQAAPAAVGRRPRSRACARRTLRCACASRCQPDLIRRRLFTVHFHAYASAEYLRKHPQPRKVEDLDQHHLVAFGAPTATHLLYDLNSLLTLGRDPKSPRAPQITVNNLAAMTHAVEHGVGIAVLPDYCVQPELRARAPAAAGRHAGDGLFPRLYRGAQERRARAGLSRLPRQHRAALALLRESPRPGLRRLSRRLRFAIPPAPSLPRLARHGRNRDRAASSKVGVGP